MKALFEKLEGRENSDVVENQYKDIICINNLKNYLQIMKKKKPKYLFIGEAPGYLGCCISGIPFTDEYSMINSENSVFGQYKNYKVHNEKKIFVERTATMVFEVLDDKIEQVLMWNIFPFHPYIKNNINTNRRPTNKEILEGIEYVIIILNMFPEIEKNNIYAIGKVAQGILEKNQIIPKGNYIRHPSFGGYKEFKNKVKEIMS